MEGQARMVLRFNPRSREGATFSSSEMPPSPARFNPRSREGSDALIFMVPTPG